MAIYANTVTRLADDAFFHDVNPELVEELREHLDDIAFWLDDGFNYGVSIPMGMRRELTEIFYSKLELLGYRVRRLEPEHPVQIKCIVITHIDRK